MWLYLTSFTAFFEAILPCSSPAEPILSAVGTRKRCTLNTPTLRSQLRRTKRIFLVSLVQLSGPRLAIR